MDLSKVIGALEGIAALVVQVAPLGGVAGPQGALIGKLVGAGAQFAEEALKHAQDASTVASASDLATIEALTATIQAENDGLAAQIDAS